MKKFYSHQLGKKVSVPLMFCPNCGKRIDPEIERVIESTKQHVKGVNVDCFIGHDGMWKPTMCQECSDLIPEEEYI